MNVRVLIQAVPWDQDRVKNAVALKKAVGDNAEIVWDEEKSGLETFLKVLRTAGDDPFVILEDDIVLADGWHEKIAAEIAARPDNLIRCFTTSTTHIYGSRWMQPDTYAFNQCTYFPAGWARGILEMLGDRRPKTYVEFHDFLVKAYLNKRKEKYWQVIPTLVDHRPFESVISSGRSVKRQSKNFAGAAEASA